MVRHLSEIYSIPNIKRFGNMGNTFTTWNDEESAR